MLVSVHQVIAAWPAGEPGHPEVLFLFMWASPQNPERLTPLGPSELLITQPDLAFPPQRL